MTRSNAAQGSDAQDSNHEAPSSIETRGTTITDIEARHDRSHQSVDFTIARTSDDELTQGFEYEFVLVIDGGIITTASRLETRGTSNAGSEADSPLAYEAPWIPALDAYARAFIDGREHGL